MKINSKILVNVFIVAAITGLGLAIILPSCRSYNFATANDARTFFRIEDAKLVDEFGDTNGPFRLVRSTVTGVGKPFTYFITNGTQVINWTPVVTNNMWFVIVVFENKKGNQYTIIQKRTDSK